MRAFVAFGMEILRQLSLTQCSLIAILAELIDFRVLFMWWGFVCEEPNLNY